MRTHNTPKGVRTDVRLYAYRGADGARLYSVAGEKVGGVGSAPFGSRRELHDWLDRALDVLDADVDRRDVHVAQTGARA